jgi:hypothetical protein
VQLSNAAPISDSTALALHLAGAAPANHGFAPIRPKNRVPW